jgi:hypothetical protein
MLKCNVRGVVSGYPLTIEPEKTEEIPCEFNRGAYLLVTITSSTELTLSIWAQNLS